MRKKTSKAILGGNNRDKGSGRMVGRPDRGWGREGTAMGRGERSSGDQRIEEG